VAGTGLYQRDYRPLAISGNGSNVMKVMDGGFYSIERIWPLAAIVSW
jgi:hypothetical protein